MATWLSEILAKAVKHCTKEDIKFSDPVQFYVISLIYSKCFSLAFFGKEKILKICLTFFTTSKPSANL